MKGHQMLAKLRKDQENEEGFTLIELLVVVIIIGILAAIAIPVFLNQRSKAWDSAAKSDVKNMSTAQETYLTGSSDNSYSPTEAHLENEGFSPSVKVQQCSQGFAGNRYVVAAYHLDSKSDRPYFYFDSDAGQLLSTDTIGSVPGDCGTGTNYSQLNNN